MPLGDLWPVRAPALRHGRLCVQFKFSQAGQDSGHNAPSSGAGVDALAQAAQLDPALAEFSDGSHDFGGVSSQSVDADNRDGVALAGVVE